MDLDETFTELAQKSGARLLRLAFQLTHEHASAEDVVQEALTRIYSSWRRRPTDVESFEAYARRAVVNEFLQRRRRRSSSEVVRDSVPETPGRDEISGVDDRDRLWRALRTLPARQRAVLVLRYYEDLPDDRIAEVIGIRRATVRSLAARGLEALRSTPALTGELT